MLRTLTIALALLAAVSAPAQQLTNRPPAQKREIEQTLTGFRVPSYNKDGEMTSQIFGDFARVMPDGYADIKGMRVEFYSYDKQTNRVHDMTVTSPRCVYHRERQAAASRDDVRLERDDMVITGTGFLWENEQQVMKITHNTKVVLKNARKDMKGEPKP